jgi:hypothetical protein
MLKTTVEEIDAGVTGLQTGYGAKILHVVDSTERILWVYPHPRYFA